MIGLVEALLFAIAAGLVGSTLGLGGALIITPILVYFGVPIKHAIAASMVAIIATSSGSASSYVRDGLSNMRAAFFLEIFTSVGAIAGALITTAVAPASFLYFLFAGFLGTSFYGLTRRKKSAGALPVRPDSLAATLKLDGSYTDFASKKEVTYSATKPLVAAPGMFVAGLAGGMLGIGGGAFKTAVQEVVMGMPSKVATATSNFMIGMTALAGASVYFSSGLVYLDLAAPLAIGTTLGALAGARLLPRLKDRTVRLLFLAVLVVLIAEMVYKGSTSL